MERVVSRSDLVSEDFVSSNSPEPEPEPTAQQEQLARLEFIPVEDGNERPKGDGDAADEQHDEFDFRLFGAAKSLSGEQQLSGSVQKIRLRSPLLSEERSGLLEPQRSPKYYFTKLLSDSEKRDLRLAAVTGEEVLAQAHIPWPGSSYPWRVLHLSIPSLNKAICTPGLQQPLHLHGSNSATKRKRHGKQYRIKLRQKHAALKAEQDARRVADETTKANQRENKTRRNRAKKVKKRLRDKAKQTAEIANPVETTQSPEVAANP